MKDYFVDLHIHIGQTESGEPVKISGAKTLTFRNIAKEASERKGIEVVGIIDCASPNVQKDIRDCLYSGEMVELPGGGIRYRDTVIILGSEIEVRDPGMGPAHLLTYLPSFADMESFSEWLKPLMKNPSLSTQRIRTTARELQQEVKARGGIVIPAHIFTPHKSLYGSCTDRMSEILDPDDIAAVELGLSADTQMASLLLELDPLPFVTNSDAHSLAKIGREYNKMRMDTPSFGELVKGLAGLGGRSIVSNYGLNPRLGKYHRTYCESCEMVVDEVTTALTDREGITSPDHCLYCGSKAIVRGVLDRITSIANRTEPDPAIRRPPYRYQVPLEFIPGLGTKLLDKLLARFGTEMNILHQVCLEDLENCVGEEIARKVILAREGALRLDAGGGGRYGRVAKQ
ncbi:MAG: endonuclease Q family protein [Gorillibacterium sp.]|nr:endonuclease Q family protein [Gorillibacterium sp.]